MSIPGLEVVDAGAAALEGGPHGRLCGERRDGGDGLLFDRVDGEEGRRGILVLVALRLWQLPNRGLEARLGDSGC